MPLVPFEMWQCTGYPCGINKYDTGPVGDLQPPEVIAEGQEGIFQGISEGNCTGP